MRIGVLGSGQLGRMLAQAAAKLDHSCIFYDPAPSTATEGLGRVISGQYHDHAALERFAKECDVVTYEFENIPCDTAHYLASLLPVYPPPRALEVSQDRLVEKDYLRSLSIATPAFQGAASATELALAVEAVGLPCIAKTRRLGYDGKGQFRLTSTDDLAKCWEALGHSPLIVEGFVSFSRELSVLATRSHTAEIIHYPLCHNVHRNGILHRTEIPAPLVAKSVSEAAYRAITSILEDLNYVGTLALELFEVEGEIVANEMAPRVHNSGHATIDCLNASQFENHIRAVTGMPLVPPEITKKGVMYNIIGRFPDLSAVSKMPNARIHLYNKAERSGRKIGHITLLDPSPIDDNTVEALCSDRE
jgi:5-(carboxyamino)imidazole ribonucleotide synthase